MRDCGLEIVESREFDDCEFGFDGPASSEILLAWEQRFDRMVFPKQYFGEKELSRRKEDFLTCLKSTEHRTERRPRLVVGRKP